MALFRRDLASRTLRGRLLVWHVVAVLGVLLALAVVLDRVLESFLVSQLTDSLISEARTVQATLPPAEPGVEPGGTLEEQVRRLGSTTDVRVTVIRTDGVVLADSEHDPATMENHRTRPEVLQALKGTVGVATRISATIGIPFRYVALPPRGGRIVRVALPLTTVRHKLTSLRIILAVGFGLAALAGVAVLWVVARGVSEPLARMSGAVERLGGGDFEAEVPEDGTTELRLLARTLNQMRAEVASRILSIQQDRAARDAVLASLEEGVVMFDPKGQTVYRNASAERLLGNGVLGVRDLVPASLQRLAQAALAGRRGIEEVASPAPPRALVVSAVPVPPDGNALLVVRDVTQARRIDSVRRDFVANASHELKTPVASIHALAETIGSASREDPEAAARFAGQLEREALRLSRMISDLLDLSRLEGGPGEVGPVRFDLVVRDEVERQAGRAAENGIELSAAGDDGVVVQMSERDAALLVRNLVENAIHYTRPGGAVRVRLDRSDGEVRLDVADTGIGIPTRDRSRVFERFFRVDRARSRETGGTGLGLSIVKHVAESYGGSVSVESELGRGSTFTVTLPGSG